MPPKIKVTREDILRAAIDGVRKNGEESLNARTIAERLGVSTQPVFSNFADMKELRSAVIKEAERLSEKYIEEEIASGKYPPYKASGMAYIRFAKEERELFKLLYMRSRECEDIPESTALGDKMNSLVNKNTGLLGDSMRLFHLEMWAYVHGIATMMATGYLELDWEIISRSLTDVYQGLKGQCEVK